MNYYTDVLKKYTVFTGRAGRKEFWMFALWNLIIGIVLGVIESILAQATGVQAFMFILWIYALAVLLPGIGVAVRRLHDLDMSGWWVLIDFVPFIGGIVLLVLFVMDSKPDNKYGPNPKGSVAAPAATA